jgi:predicted transcriptional regulator
MNKPTSLRIDETKLNRLDALAETMGLSRGQAINEAVDRYLEYNDWFLTAVDKGLKDIEEGRIVSEVEMEAVFKKWDIIDD